MGAHTWTSDAAVGVYKNHHITNQLLITATGKCKIAQFAKPFPGNEGKTFKRKGETVNIMHVKEPTAPTSYDLDESTKVPINKVELGNRAVTIGEKGRGMSYTDLKEQLSKFAPKTYLQAALIRDLTNALDDSAGAALTSTDAKIRFIPTSLTGGTFDTDGTASTVATANLTAVHIGVLADYLSTTIHCPPYENDDYICLSCSKTLRGLKDDEKIQSVEKYLRKGDLFFIGEVGKWENLRFVEVHRESALSNTAGTSTVLGRAVVFGDQAIGYAEAESPSLRVDPDHQKDFERVKAIAWVGTYVHGAVWNTATDGEAKIIVVDSA